MGKLTRNMGAQRLTRSLALDPNIVSLRTAAIIKNCSWFRIWYKINKGEVKAYQRCGKLFIDITKVKGGCDVH